MDGREILEAAPRGKIPKEVHPMLATLVQEPFTSDDYIFEVKWDGFRAIAEIAGKKLELYSRNQISFLGRFPEIEESIKGLKLEAVLDGEIVVLDKTGFPSFELIQYYRTAKVGTPVYYVFDILYLNGHDLTGLPLLERKKILNAIIPKSSHLRISEFIEAEGDKYFLEAKRLNLEGIVGKKKDSKYLPGVRNKDWLKIKTHLTQEAVIGGFTEPRGGRTGFGSLILGVYEDGNLRHIGNVGGGFNEKKLTEIYGMLKKIEIPESPFDDYGHNGENHWVSPEKVVEVKFAEWTRDNHLRQPIFIGFRDDKNPLEVKKENPEA